MTANRVSISASLISFGMLASAGATEGGAVDAAATAAAVAGSTSGSPATAVLPDAPLALGVTYGARGIELRLVRPLASGETSLDLLSVGRAVVAILSESESRLSPADQASVIESLLYNFELLERGSDARVGLLTEALAPVRRRPRILDSIVNTPLRAAFGNLYLALRLAVAHRRLVPAAENDGPRQLVVNLAFARVQQTLNNQTLMKSAYPDARDLREILAQFRDSLGAGSRGVWEDLVARMERDLRSSLEREIDEKLGGREFRTGLATAGLTFAGMLGASWGHDITVSREVWPLVFLSPIFVPAATGMTAGLAMMGFRGPRAERERLKIDAFVEDCRRALLD